MTKLLNNLPIENLTIKTDYLGIIDKGNLIKSFLIGNKEQFNEIKMFSLYGEWGSGKSSLMKYLQKELDNDFNTFFFEAWEFEKDENLAMSLLEFINSKNIDTGEQFCEDLLKYGGRILRGLGKSVKLNVPLYPNGPTLDLDMSGFVEEFSQKEDLSFYSSLNKFKTEFIRFEDKITKSKKEKYNIIFIDDLDRCEPEQVLNLLSAIKLFFTYGQKTIFFCGIDKKVAEQAVKTKYGEIVIANEYLEKIFDISFSMPEYDDLQKLINYYFDETIYNIDEKQTSINEIINNFFIFIEFTNPRKVKKALNKFQYFRDLKELSLPNKFLPFPNIDLKDRKQNSLFETILVIYLIIIHEFQNECFNDFLDFEKRKSNYSKGSSDSEDFKVINHFIEENYSLTPFEDFIKMKNLKQNEGSRFGFQNYFLICFGPTAMNEVSINNFYFNKSFFIETGNKVEYLFFKYLSENIESIIKKDEKLSKNSLKSIKKLINDAL